MLEEDEDKVGDGVAILMVIELPVIEDELFDEVVLTVVVELGGIGVEENLALVEVELDN